VRYHELRLKDKPKLEIEIRPGHMGIPNYQIDAFGQDDGSSRDPTRSFRLILEVGAGYFTCLLVIGMAQPDGLGRFTNFWLKGIVAVEVDMEEYGPPSVVVCGPLELPAVFSGVTLWRGETQTARFDVTGCSFEATTKEPDAPVLTMRWRLSDDGLLWWTSDGGWWLLTRTGSRQLDAEEKVTFVDPSPFTR
jgi:hypothetical protein